MTTSKSRTAGAGLRSAMADGALAGSWMLDPARSSVQLESSKFWGLVKVRGAFTQVRGKGVLATDGSVFGELIIEAASIATRNKQRDKSLRSAHFFNTQEFPHIVFTAARIMWSGEDGLVLGGSLRVCDRERDLRVPIAATLSEAGALALGVRLDIDRSEYGLVWNRLGLVSMSSSITISAVLTRH